MGIQGLLPALQPITKDIHIRSYANQRVAIDGYAWLHRGAYSCSQELCLGIPTTKYITFFMSLIEMLRSNKVTPVVVFDGGPLPNKKGKEDERLHSREEHLKKAKAYLLQGNTSQANSCYQKAVDITPRMAFNLIKELRKRKIEYIVAPYEADAQLAYLSITGQVDAIITEDSDLVAYGAPCMIFKMSKDGYGKEVRIENISSINKGGWDFMDFNLTMVRQMCILSGCDYLPSLPGMGLKTSYKLIKEHRDIQRVLRYLRREKGIARDDYEKKFNNADFTFLHQRVWDPVSKTVTTVLPFDREYEEDEISFIGPLIDNDIAEQIAMGVIDPETREVFDSSIPIPTFTFNPQPKKLLYSIRFSKSGSNGNGSNSLNTSSNSISLNSSTSTTTTTTSTSTSTINNTPLSFTKISQYFEKTTTSPTNSQQFNPDKNNSNIYDSDDDEDNVYTTTTTNNDDFCLDSDFEDDGSDDDDDYYNLSPPTMGISHFSINSQQQQQQQQQKTPSPPTTASKSKFFTNYTPSKSVLDESDDSDYLMNNNNNNNNNSNGSKGKTSLVSSNERFSMNFFDKFQFTKKESYVFRSSRKSISESSLSLTASTEGYTTGGNGEFNTINETASLKSDYSSSYSSNSNSNSYSLSQPLTTSSSSIGNSNDKQQQEQQTDKRKISTDDYSSFILKKPKYNGNLNTSNNGDDGGLGRKSHSFSSFDYDNVFDDDDFIGKPTPTKNSINNNNNNNNNTNTNNSNSNIINSPIQTNISKIQSQNSLVFTPKSNNNNNNNNNFITPNNNNDNSFATPYTPNIKTSNNTTTPITPKTPNTPTTPITPVDNTNISPLSNLKLTSGLITITPNITPNMTPTTSPQNENTAPKSNSSLDILSKYFFTPQKDTNSSSNGTASNTGISILSTPNGFDSSNLSLKGRLLQRFKDSRDPNTTSTPTSN
ncbi:hypothetical protein CYY_000619 [Polysphondylium violaceum]|uniref:Exonuclease 1 n=1 Tax=Polysphondylium violaceum TaxID=133409 RepID=A0A8J4Q163_9MYCE|nr:hypothetical protein CYY_000619 [Polysphondylium violaceum]